VLDQISIHDTHDNWSDDHSRAVRIDDNVVVDNDKLDRRQYSNKYVVFDKIVDATIEK
jgi:hypothetical protein